MVVVGSEDFEEVYDINRSMLVCDLEQTPTCVMDDVVLRDFIPFNPRDPISKVFIPIGLRIYRNDSIWILYFVGNAGKLCPLWKFVENID